VASMGDMGAGTGMLVVETIAKIRRVYFVQKKPIKTICREFRLSRKVVRKVILSEMTEFHYQRGRPCCTDGRANAVTPTSPGFMRSEHSSGIRIPASGSRRQQR
jgi:hypothetical protein